MHASVFATPRALFLADAVHATNAPTFLASCTANEPTNVAPPMTSSFWFGFRFPRSSPVNVRPAFVNNAWYAVRPASGKPAAATASTPSVFAHSCVGATAYCAKAPALPCAGFGSTHVSHRPRSAHTVSPTWKSDTPGGGDLSEFECLWTSEKKIAPEPRRRVAIF